MTHHESTKGDSGVNATLNPYSVGLKLIFRRLFWDLSLTARSHRKVLKALKNKYQGEKAVICCNGPSLLDVDFTKLNGIYTFGLNKINLIFAKNEWRPSCIVAVNPLVIAQNQGFLNETEIPLFLDHCARRIGINRSKNVTLLDSCDFPSFSRDCSISIFQGFTVTYVAMQLAYHLGFKKIALVGCDHAFSFNGNPNQIAVRSGPDVSHFDPSYFDEGQEWQHPDLLASELYYDLARRSFEQDGRSIINASTKTALRIFPQQTLEEFLIDGS